MSIPLALIGVVVTLWITRKPIGIGVIIGGIMLAGIVVNNAIILVDRINRLRKGNITLLKAIVRGGSDRLRPILLTTSTTILALIPMAVDRSEASNLWSPLAITVIGGLLFSTILTLILVPSIYIIFEDIHRSFQRKTLLEDAKLVLQILKHDTELVRVKVKDAIDKVKSYSRK
jgi:HAE1 family hydrophobic/amphiphilic exporter-1